MPLYQIDMTVNFSGEVHADSEEEALTYFIENREHRFYESLESSSIDEVEEDEEDEDD